MTRMAKISWNGRCAGTDVPVSYSAKDGIELIARHMAAMYGELQYESTLQGREKNVMGMGAAYAQHLHATDSKAWERFKGAAVTMLESLHGTGEKGLPLGAPKSSQAMFTELHDFAQRMRHGR